MSYKYLLNKIIGLDGLSFPFPIRCQVYLTLLTYNIINSKNIFDHMGSLHHQPSQDINAEKLFLFKEMIKKTSVSSPTIHYKFLEMLGQGSSSQIYKVQFLGSGQYRVIKKVRKCEKVAASRQILNQYEILRQLDHPNIRRIYEMFEDQKYHYVVTQYLPGRDALELLLTNKQVNEDTAFRIFYQTLLSLNYLHKNNIMHRDIKLQNIIYDEYSMCFKLIDFGSALRFSSPAPRQRRCTGTINYMAPEVINKYYNMKCDVWSLGIMLFVLLSGNAPFADSSHEEIIHKTLKQPLTFKKSIWESRSKEVKTLLSKMLEKNFERRPNISQIFKDPWVLKYKQSQGMHKSQKEAICTCLQKLIKFSKVKVMTLQMGIIEFMNYFLIRRQNEVAVIQSFLEIDQQNDGQLYQKELKQALVRFLGLSTKAAEEATASIMSRMDVDSSGYISFSQFILGATDLRSVLSYQNICKTFRYFDVDNSKKISASQLQLRLGSHLDEGHYARILKSFDENKDSQMDLAQFVKMMSEPLKNY